MKTWITDRTKLMKIHTGPCWEDLSRSLDGGGYTNASWPETGYPCAAHLLSYKTICEKYDTSLHLDHLCRNKLCYNPRHLEVVTRHENMARLQKSERTHCINGHELTIGNTYVNSRGTKTCRICLRVSHSRWRARNGNKLPRRDHCLHGHEWTPGNTYIRPSDQARICRECMRHRAAIRRQKNRQELLDRRRALSS